MSYELRPTGGGSFSQIASSSSAPFSATWDATTVATGSYDLRPVITDRAGNTFTGAAVTFNVDVTAPTVTLTNPGATIAGTVTLNATVSGSGATRSLRSDARRRRGLDVTRHRHGLALEPVVRHDEARRRPLRPARDGDRHSRQLVSGRGRPACASTTPRRASSPRAPPKVRPSARRRRSARDQRSRDACRRHARRRRDGGSGDQRHAHRLQHGRARRRSAHARGRAAGSKRQEGAVPHPLHGRDRAGLWRRTRARPFRRP